MPRILPLVGIAVGGVLAINALAGARDLPSLMSGARAFAEEATAKTRPAKGEKTDKAKAPDKSVAVTGDAKDTAGTALPPPTIQPRGVCAPTAAELAKEAGLSPAELQQLQNLGARRSQLDQRESDLSTQVALLAAAEAKVDAKMRALTGLKTDVQNLLTQADGREAAEVDRLVKVFEGMKPKDAAPRMAILEDSVRLPIAAKMKERSLSAIVGQMSPQDAKKLTESLAHRFTAAHTLAQAAAVQADAPAAATGALPAPVAPAKAKAKPARQAKKAAPRKTAPESAEAAASPPPAPVPVAAAPAAAAAPASAPAKAG
ncbi:MotE family protein [Phenylobacterium sp.]|jgi:flagellar motility protein MotE (MotC chaperone)|uniref:MotE family protein n=1 Tax=Phenylobacterium sp. TaxID=1871053 RepID=UPI002E35731C|nr:MotE family protein [Phenylobacterium sp.]HEX4710975.1 MotE family protein [Phenylobacterium sp.]